MAITAPEHPLDERLARTAVSLGLDAVVAVEDAADRLVALAGGNRTAVVRALGRVAGGGHAAQLLRMALARGSWAW
ncbi:MAG: hypothetical protein ACRD2W_00145 [Acidimicrobiales bacterium]